MHYNPTLGAVTAAFEFFAAAWVFRGPGRKTILNPIALLLVFLGVYQVLEVVICWGGYEENLFLSRLAFIDVTWLPPLTILLTSRLAPARFARGWSIYARIALSLAAVMSVWIFLDYRFITRTMCQVVYASYSYIEPWFHIYGAFYEITQLSLVFWLPSLIARTEDSVARSHLGNILTGVLLYVVPSFMLGTIFDEALKDAQPSVMCHFAGFFAVNLVMLVQREQRQCLELPVLAV